MSASVTEEFGQLTAPFRRELLVHCYRMLGSVHDAEDTVQETYLRAWRAFDKFEGRSSLRTWLHRIATTACLSALQNRNRRPLPSGLGSSCDPGDALVERPEIPWLEPLPDTVDGDPGTDPGAVVELRESTRLAFIVALQHLSPRQRAVLILRDVLSWKASEVAEAVGVSTAAVNSMLQRARTQVRRATSPPGIAPAALSVQQRQLLDRYVEAFEAKDVAALQELFTSDAVWEMPPFLNWVRGASRISRLVDLQCPAGPGDMRLLPTSANGNARSRCTCAVPEVASTLSSCRCWSCAGQRSSTWWRSLTSGCSNLSGCPRPFGLLEGSSPVGVPRLNRINFSQY